jgi:hypothetical protein
MPQIFADVSLADSPAPCIAELREAHACLCSMHQRVDATYKLWSMVPYDFDKWGEPHYRFHPDGLPPAQKLLPPSEMGSESDFLKNAQRTYSLIIHHSAWLKLLARLRSVSVRECVRFLAVSQPHAGDFLNAVPARRGFKVPTWAMKIAIHRRLGLPLQAAGTAAQAYTSRHGKTFDCFGDVAQNDGIEGHTARHTELLDALVAALKSVWGARVVKEPLDYRDYSDHRPDLTGEGVGHAGGTVVGDLKLFDPIGSDGQPSMRGAFVAMGCTLPHACEVVHGRPERTGEGAFDPRTGRGRVSAVDGDYRRAIDVHGVDVRCLLFETFGGFGPETMGLLEALADERGNKLNKGEYEVTTWSARKWMSFVCQQISVALHRAAAAEIAHAMGMSVASDPRSA